MNRETSLPALIGLGALSLIWGYNWVVMKVALRYSGPFTFAALRALLGAAALFAVLPLLKRPLFPGHLGRVLLLGLLQTTAFIGLATWALVAGGAGKTAVLVYSMPIWLVLLSWPLLGERMRGWQWWVIPPTLVGLVLILHPWRYHPQLTSTILGLLAGLTWALGGAWVKVMQRHDIDRLTLTAWQLLLGGVPLLVIALLVEEPAVSWSGVFILTLLYNVVPATAVAWSVWLFVLQRLRAGTAGMGTLLTPVVGVLAAWLQLREVPGVTEGVGMALILGSLGLLSWANIRLARTGRSAG